MALFLLGFFFPFYEYPGDSRVYGFQAFQIADGVYDYSNSFLEETGYWEFVPEALVKTQHNTAIPNILPMFPAIGAFFYNLFGLSGLFYMNPIFAVLFLIISERISTKFFGKYVGLLVLVFLATNEMVFWVGRGLLTSMLFSNFFLLGLLFLLKFFRTDSDKQILIASSFFTLTAFIRPNGIIFVPVEIGIVIAYFAIGRIFQNKNIELPKTRIAKIALFTVGPWLVFIFFIIIFNIHYFGDPTVTVYNVPDSPKWSSQSDFIGELNSDAIVIDLERVEKYSIHFLPYPLNRVVSAVNYNDSTSGNEIFSNFIGEVEEIGFISHLGILSFVTIALALFIAFKNKDLRIECSVYTIFILSMIIFYSIQFIVIGRQGSARDMLPVFPLFYGLLSYIIIKFLTANSTKQKKQIFLKSSKIIVLMCLIVFFPIAFYFTDYSQNIKNEGFIFNNPTEFMFPEISNSIKNDDIVITVYKFDQVINHGAIPFSPIGIAKDFEPSNTAFIAMLEKLTDILKTENDVFVFKEPGRETEKVFHRYLDESKNYILIDYDDEFCKIELRNNDGQKSDTTCLE